MNNVSLIGRLTADPELKHTQSGISYTRFSIAVDRQYSKDKEKEADFINIIAWRGTADFLCAYFRKGMKIGITGRIQTGSYTDQNNNKRYTFDVVANDVEFVERKQSSYTGADDLPPVYQNNPDTGDFVQTPNDEDLPF